MNLPAATTLGAIAIAALQRDVAGLIADADTATTLVFTAPGARAFNPGSGTVTYTDTTTSVTAFVSDVDIRRAPPGTQAGDVQVLVAYGDLPTRPETNARFRIETGDRAGAYSVQSVTDGPFDTHYLLFARRVN
jgi:hypothetical protein